MCLKLSVISWQLLLCALELDYDTVETALISLCQCIEKVVVDQVKAVADQKTILIKILK